MKQEDFNKLFEGITSDNFQERILDMKETLSKENTLLEQSYDTIKQKDSDIAKLRDTNQRLFLRVSEQNNNNYIDDSDKEPLTLDALIADITKGD